LEVEMNLGQLAGKAKELVQRRGGTDSLKQDAEELRNIASGSGSVSDKAKAAAGAVKDPGAADTSAQPGASTPAPDPGEPIEDDRERRGRRGRGGHRRRRGRR
jgi:hypothetical protein